jgi:hypothetical protein
MNEAQKKEAVADALRWVAQEAKAIQIMGVTLPKGSRLREALAVLEQTYLITTTGNRS